MKHIMISGYSVTSCVYEGILHHHAAPNSVEEGFWPIKGNESQNITETSHITCRVLADTKIIFVDKIVQNTIM